MLVRTRKAAKLAQMEVPSEVRASKVNRLRSLWLKYHNIATNEKNPDERALAIRVKHLIFNDEVKRMRKTNY